LGLALGAIGSSAGTGQTVRVCTTWETFATRQVIAVALALRALASKGADLATINSRTGKTRNSVEEEVSHALLTVQGVTAIGTVLQTGLASDRSHPGHITIITHQTLVTVCALETSGAIGWTSNADAVSQKVPLETNLALSQTTTLARTSALETG
jgi:hypothetical protein